MAKPEPKRLPVPIPQDIKADQQRRLAARGVLWREMIDDAGFG